MNYLGMGADLLTTQHRSRVLVRCCIGVAAVNAYLPLPVENCICDFFENGELCKSTHGTQPLVSRLSCHAAIGREIDSSHPAR
jgi:hypothetical protein